MGMRVWYHVVYDRDLLDALEYAHRHGFDYIVPDLTIPKFWPERVDASHRRRYLALLPSLRPLERRHLSKFLSSSKLLSGIGVRLLQ